MNDERTQENKIFFVLSYTKREPDCVFGQKTKILIVIFLLDRLKKIKKISSKKG